MKKTYIILLGILVLGFCIRGLYLRELLQDPIGLYPIQDAAYHDYWAQGWVTGEWPVSTDHADPEISSTPYFRPPGYPLFLAVIYRLFGIQVRFAVIVQMLMGMLNVLLVFMICKRWANNLTALVAAFAMAIYWPFIFYEATLLDPILHITSLLLTLLILTFIESSNIRRTGPWCLLCGVLAGISAVIRPTTLLIIPLFIFWIIWVLHKRYHTWKRPVVYALYLSMGVLISILPVTIRNYVKAKDTVLISSNAGLMLYMGNSHMDSLTTGTTMLNELQAVKYRSCFDYPDFVDSLSRKTGHTLSYSQASAYLTDLALDHIKEHPTQFFQNLVKKAGLFLNSYEISHNHEMHYTRIKSAILKHLPGNFSWIISIALVGMYFALKKHNPRPTGTITNAPGYANMNLTLLFILFLLLYFCGMVLFVYSAQYRLPIVPLLFMLAAYGISCWIQLLKDKRFISVGIGIGIAAGLVITFQHNWVGIQPDKTQMLYQRAAAYKQRGNTQMAKLVYRKILEIAPNHAWAHGELGTILAEESQFAEAIPHFKRALQIEPDYPKAEVNLAFALHVGGNSQQAIQILDDILIRHPHQLEALNAQAWIQATHPDPKYIDAEKAIQSAEQLNELTGYSNPNYLDSLAAAYAVDSRFDEAVATTQKAVKLAQEAGQKDLVRRIDARRRIYEAGHRYIMILGR